MRVEITDDTSQGGSFAGGRVTHPERGHAKTTHQSKKRVVFAEHTVTTYESKIEDIRMYTSLTDLRG